MENRVFIFRFSFFFFPFFPDFIEASREKTFMIMCISHWDGREFAGACSRLPCPDTCPLASLLFCSFFRDCHWVASLVKKGNTSLREKSYEFSKLLDQDGIQAEKRKRASELIKNDRMKKLQEIKLRASSVRTIRAHAGSYKMSPKNTIHFLTKY